MLVDSTNAALAAGASRSNPTPVLSRPPERERSGESERAAARAERSREPDPSTETEPRVADESRSRLAFDRELSRVFVEVVDNSGEVIARFPPEQFVRHINSLVDQQRPFGTPEAAANPGLVFDEIA